MLCSLVEADGCFRGAYRLNYQGDDSDRTNETSVYSSYIPEDSHLNTRRRENVKPQILTLIVASDT
jgi:hypothetical protein